VSKADLENLELRFRKKYPDGRMTRDEFLAEMTSQVRLMLTLKAAWLTVVE